MSLSPEQSPSPQAGAVAPLPLPAAPLPETSLQVQPAEPFDPDSTMAFQRRLDPRTPVWVSSMLAGTQREKTRLRGELAQIKGGLPLLLKQRRGGTWSAEEKQRLQAMLRSASSVSPYLLIWAVPGSMLLLPFLAWYIDNRRKARKSRLQAAIETAGVERLPPPQ